MKREPWHVPCGVQRERNDLQWLFVYVALESQSNDSHGENIQTQEPS